MFPSKLFIFDEFGCVSTQLSAMPNTRTRCADSVVRSYHVYMDKWDPAIGDKFNAEMEVSNRRDSKSQSGQRWPRAARDLEGSALFYQEWRQGTWSKGSNIGTQSQLSSIARLVAAVLYS